MAKKTFKKFKLFLYSFMIPFLYEGVLGNNEVKVTTEQGVLLGVEKIPITGKGKYYSFKGIPFAEPPLGDLRFQAPKPPPKWQGVRNATNHGPICVQQSALYSDSIIGNEDCLYLNVYTPDMKPQKLLPVMFWIHGGAFLYGSGNDDMYGPDFLVGYGVILVTSNYRLGALGFFSVDTKDVPGNAGLKDQIAALQWVKKNIKCFGGDPKQVTIFGQSNGGSSVTYHMVSPVAKGLFNRAIAMSGCLFNEFGSASRHKQRAYNLGRRLGIYTNDPNKLIKFLRKVPAEKLFTILPRIRSSEEISGAIITYFGPIIEKNIGGYHYLTEQPIEIKKKGQLNVVDLMRGHAETEALKNLIERQDFYLENYYRYFELFVPLQISRLKSPAETLKIGEAVKNCYFENGTFVLNNASSFVDFYSYFYYVYPIHYFSDFFLPRNYSTNNYFYGFGIYSTRNVYSKSGGMRYGIYKATHRDDLPYLFHGSGYNITFDINDESYKYINLFCTLITNFVKYGNPTPKKYDNSLPENYKDLVWPEYYENMNALLIAKKPSIQKVQYETGNIAFWKRVYDAAGVTPYVGDVDSNNK